MKFECNPFILNNGGIPWVPLNTGLPTLKLLHLIFTFEFLVINCLLCHVNTIFLNPLANVSNLFSI